MRLTLVSVAALTLLNLGVAHSQTSNAPGAPRELPPASFTGAQYVDSRGCVFLRAGLDGSGGWVPRLTRDRMRLCGYPPTFGTNQVAPVESATRGAGAPETRVTSARRGKIGCPADTPVAERFRVVGGGTVVMCTRGDGNLATARAPRDLTGTAGTAPVARESRLPPVNTAPVGVATSDYRNPPKGFKRAWDDDRLNPNRAIGTAQGWAAQDQIWTRETPARLVEDRARR